VPRKAVVIRRALDSYESALTADFQRVYHLRLADAIQDRTVEEIWDLIVWLPDGSIFRSLSEADGDERKAAQLFGWTRTDDLILGLVNLASEQTWVIAQSHSKKPIPPPAIQPGPRGSRKPPKDSAHNTARSLMQQQR
jgi:hypothetical protein